MQSHPVAPRYSDLIARVVGWITGVGLAVLITWLLVFVLPGNRVRLPAVIWGILYVVYRLPPALFIPAILLIGIIFGAGAGTWLYDALRPKPAQPLVTTTYQTPEVAAPPTASSSTIYQSAGPPITIDHIRNVWLIVRESMHARSVQIGMLLISVEPFALTGSTVLLVAENDLHCDTINRYEMRTLIEEVLRHALGRQLTVWAITKERAELDFLSPAEVTSMKRYCRHCEALISQSATYCNACGEPTAQSVLKGHSSTVLLSAEAESRDVDHGNNSPSNHESSTIRAVAAAHIADDRPASVGVIRDNTPAFQEIRAILLAELAKYRRGLARRPHDAAGRAKWVANHPELNDYLFWCGTVQGRAARQRSSDNEEIMVDQYLMQRYSTR